MIIDIGSCPFVQWRAFKAAKTIYSQIFGAMKMERPTKTMQFLILLESIDEHLANISHTLKTMQNDEWQKEKGTQKEKDSFNQILGGIIGGENKGGIRGEKEGGEKGGGFCDGDSLAKPRASGTALKDFSDGTKNAVERFNAIIKKHLSAQEIAYLESRQQMIHAFRAYEKLQKLGYDDNAIHQALHNAFNDGFWNSKIRHFKALANTSKNGSLVIVNLLKINAGQTKINAPVIAQYRG